ncbi:unnamed protein product [Darwinula stevensoni]|uniref:Uncharacterized protein n=1 Tax=Darwinula stevensoni TaxID=69355 RepID=A0A7R9ABN3_9CRUS|nr:unnamed protein product [Darwinula stevensoni]CAG0899340.1 unnamed protein product [Darwinula stevensoni]
MESVNIGGGKERPFTEAQNDYLQEYYPEADAHLKENDFKELLKSLQQEEKKLTDRKDVDLPPMHIAITAVFQQAKKLCSDAPSLVIADYVISETFNRNEIFTTAMKNMPDDERNKLFKVKPEFIKRGSGTGKTIIVKEIAKLFAERDEVLLVNLAGGELTKRFRGEFQGAHQGPQPTDTTFPTTSRGIPINPKTLYVDGAKFKPWSTTAPYTPSVVVLPNYILQHRKLHHH